ncbi:LANO_0A07250g1_1 [Lachancea nothofagi CBS 11611]|uniref:LANO_0A07250g1_1 n=1 Tax=Lachancea nothofagi CBS 11611 TaxID=1266666 RepID=A0A1G4ISC6_9SACH|nr:LANO_0A07250g1_1 [Lachancea nothofagi CBS 11611]
MSSTKPNFLIIVADDLGFTDLGSFGGEIDTPNLDALANEGLKFTGFHTASACSPTRSMLLSGTDNHLAGLGQMAEYARNFPEKFGGKPGYEGYLNFRVAALPEILTPEYYTFISGKWHLGLDEPYWPDKRGFEQSFTLLPGAGNHFKYDTSEKEFMPFIYQENGRRLDPEKELPDDFYSTDYFTTKFLEYLKNDEKRKGRPFLSFLTYTAPHWPLQAPAETINKYKGFYDKGPLALRKERLAKAANLGIIAKDAVPHLVETKEEKAWDELDKEKQNISARKMEVYAAMVDEMDKNIGRIINQLKSSGEYDNTVILFLSDNGAEGMLLEALPFGGKSFADKITNKYNNAFTNIGKGDSFVYYGDLWAQAATAPRYMYKMWATEGGINCPLIMHYPKLAKAWAAQNVVHEFTTVMDILPTVLDFADVPHPGKHFKGREVHIPKGSSWASFLNKSSNKVHDDNTVTGWELFGQRAIRRGNYKALYVPKPFGSGEWELYDLSKDLGETVDLSGEQPRLLDELINHWAIYSAETGLIEANEYPEGTEYFPKIIKDA